MKQLIPIDIRLALVTSQAQTANVGYLSTIKDCEFASQMLQDTTPYIQKLEPLSSINDYKDKPISREVSIEFVIRTKLFAQEAYNLVRKSANSANKARITYQSQMMRVPVDSFLANLKL